MAFRGTKSCIGEGSDKATCCLQCCSSWWWISCAIWSQLTKAVEVDLFQPLARRALQHRISLYADDVVIFPRPSASDLEVMLDLLTLFGEASELKTNMQKSSVLPIQCTEEEKAAIQEQLPCQMLDFPCKYLRVPLSLQKLTTQVQPIIDKIADCLPGWKADLLTRAGRKSWCNLYSHPC